MDLTLGVALFAGLISFLSPCVLPVVPAYLGQLGAVVARSGEAAVVGASLAVSNSYARRSGAAPMSGQSTPLACRGRRPTAWRRCPMPSRSCSASAACSRWSA